MQKTINATALARNLSSVLDELAAGGGEVAIERHGRTIGRLVPGPARMNALQALADIYRTLPEEEGRAWEADIARGRHILDDSIRNPWAAS